ncbi:MAG: transglycosylase domain-containing protein, partial [Candidatus Nanopelagicales bacterium]|nr:transglycosylase domain-containing protein [Candidatus Nanopelagicales bacterium]
MPKRRHWLRRIILGGIVIVVVAIVGFIVALSLTTIPTPNELATTQATIVYYADGTNEVGRLGDSSRRSVPLAQVPDQVQKAVLAAEDREFYNHGGISPVGFIRALFNNATGGATQGGSTITQQYAKNAFLTQERSWSRKIKEALLSMKIETVQSKDQILENYLNTIYFGRNAYGIDAAARSYFGKPVADLTLSEGAALAAIINSPSYYAQPERAGTLRGRWNYVLDGMLSQGWITEEQRSQVRFPDLNKAVNGNRLGGQTGYLLQAVKDQLVGLGFDEAEVEGGGFRIVTTLEKKAEDAAIAAVDNAGPKSRIRGLRIGLASVRPATGEIVALYGGKDFITDQINNATRPFAQAGSTFKPFALAAATERDYNLSTVWNGNSPTTVNGYTLTNYNDKSYGQVSLLKATLHSINSAYVQLESAVGVDRVADAAVRAGVPSDTPGLNLDKLDLTFVLGTASPSGLAMANAYGTFANQGVRASSSIIKQVLGTNGGLLYEYQPSQTAEFDSRVANTVTYALGRNVERGTAFAARDLGRPAAAKTGTTDGNKSAWFVGYTPQLSTAVLMAKEQGGLPVSLSGTGGLTTVTGGSFPAAMWTAYMKRALRGTPVVPLPDPPASVTDTWNCADLTAGNGGIPPLGCPNASVTEFGPEPVGEAGIS